MKRHPVGGVIHAYQKYDPASFPPPTQEAPDLITPAFEQAMMYGEFRELSEEELARAVELDPSQIKGLGPSIDFLKQMLLERKRKILETYEAQSVQKKARKAFHSAAKQVRPPEDLVKTFREAINREQPYLLEALWYRGEDRGGTFSTDLLKVASRMADKHQLEELAGKYDFTGSESMSIPKALEIKEELEQIDELLKQLDEAAKTAKIGLIDMEKLNQFVPTEDMQQLEEMRRQVENIIREQAERQGLERGANGQFRLTPQAYKVFQGRLLERIFSELAPSRSGRHQGDVVGEGAVELQQTKPYEFGDSIANMDIPQTVINTLLRQGDQRPLRLHGDDIEIHKTRNHPKCATCVVMDMSGSMRYDGQYMNVKRMALALQGLIQTEYPGDFLRFIEMYTFAKMRAPGEVINLMPKPVTIHDPWVRLKVDMSDEHISETQIHQHFTNIQRSLQLARQNLAATDTPNRQIVLITDGLPTAHNEGEWLYMLYPPDPQTEQATMREAMLCSQEGITINIFLVPSWSQSEEDIRFASRLAKTTKGRVFFTSGNNLDRFVLWDYVQNRREIIS
ncbi:vWA domain-containing protein [Roseiconus lacunae]|uniref:VWA domain-containing protein n=1 Tax=Roseiconus lacunae TaxID=2605694 RepID=A0ABT7PIB5_9BACT|nr:VWA domain-containing protein [Roseiconus lacunae]MCD0458354.1 VWA domain-containing protein [Roseiconus lacunae]MDM4016244.1 VWA domain-containing protein [Roseiconus lacunae]WRQ52153.1 VWA domain-containing protein [Stieleria sp. HD01]